MANPTEPPLLAPPPSAFALDNAGGPSSPPAPFPFLPGSIGFVAGTLGQGGAERQLFHLAKTLLHHGARVTILSLTQGDFYEPQLQAAGIRVVFVGGPQSKIQRLAKIIREAKRRSCQILQSQHFYANFYAAAAARILRRREIGAMRSDGISEFRQSGPLRWLNLFIPRLIAANSQAALRYAASRGVPARKLCFLPNVIDTAEYHPKPKPPSPIVQLIAVGRLTAEKRFDRFLNVLAQVRRQSSLDVRGIIVGEGRPHQDLLPALKQQAADLGLQPPAIQFRGALNPVAPAFQEADICVLTSDYEGTPNVLLEALATGLPVVATRVGGIPDIVQHGRDGFLADPSDEPALIDAILRLAKDPSLRESMGRRARACVEAHHSLHRLPALLDNLYSLALSSPKEK